MTHSKKIMKMKTVAVLATLALGTGAFSVMAAPVNNINAPIKGVSHNIYPEFNVGKEGVVFNNSMQAVDSQLAGKIAANANLLNNIYTNGAASVIIAEVRSKTATASQLNGMMEVAGKKAELIIANPAGINCNGCGSINTSRLSLVAGKTIPDIYTTSPFGSSDIYFQTENGNVTIDRGGLKSGQTDFTDIIARSVKVNGEIQAKSLTLLTGEMNVARKKYNKLDAIYNSVSSSSARPAYALDVASLGGMYVDQISMIGSEKGVGVRNSGKIVSKGVLSLVADGKLINNNSGTLRSDQTIFLESKARITNYGQISAKNNFLEAKSFVNADGGSMSSTASTLIFADTYYNFGKTDLGNGLSAHVSFISGNSILK